MSITVEVKWEMRVQTVGFGSNGKKVEFTSTPTINPTTGAVTSISIPSAPGGGVVVSPS